MFVRRRHHEKKSTLGYFFGAIKRHTIKSALETVPVFPIERCFRVRSRLRSR